MITNIAWRFLARIDTVRISGLEHFPAAGLGGQLCKAGGNFAECGQSVATGNG